MFGLLFVAAVAGIVMASRKPAVESSIASASASASASSPPPSTNIENPVRTDPVAPTDAGADSATSSAFHMLADGGPVPALSDDAPAVGAAILPFTHRLLPTRTALMKVAAR